MKHRTFQPEADHASTIVPTTLADVLSRLAVDPALSPTRRRDLRSAVRGMGRILGVSLDAIPASPRVIRQRLKGLEPAQAGLSPKRFANIKSDVLAALRLVGAVDRPVNRSRPMAPAWDRLWHRIDYQATRWKLGRLFRYCSDHDIEPEEVDDETVLSLRRLIEDTSMIKDPAGHVRGVIWAWNRCQEEIADWPPRRLSPLQIGPRGWTLPIAKFPASFQADLERWTARLRGDDPFADDALARPLRPATIKHRAFQVRMFASALVLSGHDHAEVIALTV